MNSIWFQDYTLEQLNGARLANMTTHLGIEYTVLDHNSLTGTMPVDKRTTQPFGILHGGASCVLAESLGSVCAWMTIDPSRYSAVGLEINANHIRPASKGHVIGQCSPVHVGRRTQVWAIEIRAESTQKLVCTSRLTVAIIEKESIKNVRLDQ